MNSLPLNPLASSYTPGAGPRMRERALFASFQDFLKLLTTQLQQQDPLTPMDAEKFSQQLIQFAAVEQARAANERLSKLIDTVAAGQLLMAASFVGREVDFSGREVFVGEQGEARIAYSLPRSAAVAELIVRQHGGAEVVRFLVPPAAGRQVVTWDGRDAHGTRVPPGTYRVEIRAEDEAGQPVVADLRTVAVVDAVFFEDGQLLLSAGGMRHPATSVIAIRQGVG